MKRILCVAAIASSIFISSNAVAEDDFDHKVIESVCASVKTGKSRYNLRIQGSIRFLAFVKEMDLTERPAFSLKIMALAVRKAENDKNCPELNNALIPRAILHRDFSDAIVPIIKKAADTHIKSITTIYKAVKEEFYDCETISGFVSVPNFYVLACDQNSRYYSLNANRPFVEFCGNSLNERCFW